MEWNVQIPTGRVQARVQDAWVSLEGQVDHDFQRREVERMVRHVRGVVGITDTVSVTSPVNPVQVEAQIQDAFQREADVDSRQVRVEVSDHTARLYGHVHSLREAGPGVARVESHLTIIP